MIILFLRALYDAEGSMDYSDKDYEEMLESIVQASIGSQVYSLLKSSGRLWHVPSFFREKLSQIYQACFLQNMLVRHETQLLLREFDKNGIPVIPLKGTTLAERYFGHFAARGTSDIDLLIKPEHMRTALVCIARAGYATPLEENPEHYHREWVKTMPGLPEPLPVELHWSFAPGSTSRMNMAAAWESSEPMVGYKKARTLGTTYTFYSLCLHGASHQMDSLKHALDLYQLLHSDHENIDIDWIWKQSESDRTRRRVIAALTTTYRLFPELNRLKKLPFEPKNPFLYTRQPALPHPAWRTLYTLAVMDSWKYRLRYLWQTVFPSRSYARYSLDAAGPPASLPKLYYRLYKQRLRKIFGGA
ncbi:nucleotidyltransferase family protein [Cohnella cholangitidis]|uniref:nucleotidyltransferase family protein n=1 Tax=Cohnella cholangitidis TaxID=2598458 RepID=UPI0015FD11B7|nr:nucleotidyltransferase family protein [Cohnella cholangitidis]